GRGMPWRPVRPRCGLRGSRLGLGLRDDVSLRRDLGLRLGSGLLLVPGLRGGLGTGPRLRGRIENRFWGRFGSRLRGDWLGLDLGLLLLPGLLRLRTLRIAVLRIAVLRIVELRIVDLRLAVLRVGTLRLG